jgi:hypothetical protein
MKNDINNRFGAQEGRRIVESLSRGDKAYIERAAQLNPTAIRVQTFDLATAPLNSISVGFAWKSCYIVSGTDASCNILIRPFSDSENNDYVPMSLKDVLSFDNPINKCFVNWTAQLGKTITVVFFTDAKFTSGSFLNEVSSTVDGNSINEFAPVTVSTTAANAINSTVRNVINIVNEGPDDCYIGGSGVSAVSGSERGLFLAAGNERQYKNTAAVYAASLGTSVIRFQTES